MLVSYILKLLKSSAYQALKQIFFLNDRFTLEFKSECGLYTAQTNNYVTFKNKLVENSLSNKFENNPN